MKRKFTMVQFLFASLFTLLSGLHVHSQAYEWKNLPMGAGGFVSGIITSKQEQNLIYARTDVGGAYRWNAATGNWIPLQDWSASNQSGFYGVESVAIDPHATNKLYMLVGISYFDNGKTAILRSEDYGQTFTTIDVSAKFKTHGNGMGRSNGERLQVDPNLGSTLYVGTRYNGLWKSTNSGTDWTRLDALPVTTTPNGNGICFVAIDPASGSNGVASQKIYVGVSRYDTTGVNLYVSENAGATFTPITGGPGFFMPQRAKLLGNGDMIINYANGSGPYGTTTEPMNNGRIFKYNTGSGMWTNITPSGISRAWGGLSVDPANPNRIIASTINNYQNQYNFTNNTGGTSTTYGDRIYYTTNGGTSWTDIVARGFTLNPNGIPWIIGQAIHWAGSVEFDPFNTNKVLITSGNGIFTNDNVDVASTPWKFDVLGLEELVPRDMVSITNGPLFTVVSDYDGFKHTDINQYGQRVTPTMGTTTGIAYAGINPNVMIRVGPRMYYSTDQGITWTQTGTAMGTEGRVTISADGITFLHCPNGSSTTYYSRNNGTSWTASNINVSNAIPVADMVNPNKIYIYNNGSGNFNVSNDGGATFAVTSAIGSGGSKIIRTVPGKEGHIWVALGGSGLRRSVNSGTSFTTITGVTRCDAIGLGKAAPDSSYHTLYMWGTVSGVTGIFRSVNEGANWVRVNDDAHQFGGPGNGQFVMGDMNTYGIVYMSTVGRGVVTGRINGTVSVSLVSLHVKEAVQNNRPVALLNWKTVTESNASHFTIERSADARNWAPVGTIATKATNGNSNLALNYAYPDDIVGLSSLVYYRLKMTDKNGHYQYSNTVSLDMGKQVKGLIVSVSPNPVETATGAIVRFTANKDQQIVMKVIAADGALVLTKSLTLQSGSTSITLSELANKPAGIYTLTIISTEKKRVGVVRFAIR